MALQVDAHAALAHACPPDRLERGAVGRRQRSLVAIRRGKYSRARLAERHDRDVAVDATVRAAAVRSGRHGTALAIAPEDVRRKVREHRVPFEICFVVDNSYSLHADRMVEKVKGLVFRLLEDASSRGDRVALVAFRAGRPEATVALRPTASLALASSALRRVPLAGRTPLPDALRTAGKLLRQELRRRPNARPILVLASDGLANVPLRRGGDPVADAIEEARALRRAGIALVVVDTTVPGRPGGASCGPALAAAADGLLLPLGAVSPDAFAGVLERLA